MKHFLTILMLGLSVLAVRGELYSFDAITANDNSGTSSSTGESQFFMDVSTTGAGQASLTFSNVGPEQSVITEIYFDAAPELNFSIIEINNSGGVNFKLDSHNPKNMPAGQSLDNVFNSDLTLSAKSPKASHGISPFESLEIILDYDDSYDLFDVMANRTLRIGLHGQSFAGGYSESYLNTATHGNIIPEPATLSMLFVGAFLLRWFRQR